MKLTVKKSVIAMIAIIVIISSIAMFLLLPRGTKKEINIWDKEANFDINDIKAINMSGEEFKILAITDIQFDNPFKSKKELKNDLKKMAEYVKPDLIVSTGDNFAGIFNHFHVKAFTEIMDSLNVPWTTVFGNHERDFKADLYYLSKQMRKSKNLIFFDGPTNIDGVGNFFINIEKDGQIVQSLIMMDSNEEVFRYDGRGNRLYAYYDGPRVSQIEWYKYNLNGIKDYAGKVVPSILFTHTGLSLFKELYNDYAVGGNSYGSVFKYGEIGENVSGAYYDYGLYDAISELGSTKYHFFGHDHENNISLSYKGLTMSYVNKTGNFSSFVKDKTGGTLIVIDKNGTVKHENIFASKI